MGCSSQQDCSQPRFAGDRYQRFSQGAQVVAEDPAVIGGSYPFNAEGLGSFASSVTQQRLLDCLSERESDLVSMMMLLDYHKGPGDIAERLHHWIVSDHETMAADRVWAVASVLAALLALLCNRLGSLDAR